MPGDSLLGLCADRAGMAVPVLPVCAEALEIQAESWTWQRRDTPASALPDPRWGGVELPAQAALWQGWRSCWRGGSEGLAVISVLLQVIQGALADNLDQGSERTSLQTWGELMTFLERLPTELSRGKRGSKCAGSVCGQVEVGVGVCSGDGSSCITALDQCRRGEKSQSRNTHTS